MSIERIQRKLDKYFRRNPASLEFRGPGGAQLPAPRGNMILEIESWRHRIGGMFGQRSGVNFFDWAKRGILWEPTSEWAFAHNLVTNQGLEYVIDVGFDNVADIATWQVVYYTNAHTPAAGNTYAVPGYTEATTTNVDEAVRQDWVEGDGSGTTTHSISNSASPARYTGDNSHSAVGAALVGGSTTIGDTAASPAYLYALSNFSASVSMTVDATLDITYTVSATDDGV